MTGTEAYGGSPRPPVVLVHGTNDTSAAVLPLAHALRAGGRDVTLVDYGRHPASLRGRRGAGGLGPLWESEREVVREVAAVLAATRAPYVDLIGHSQGGLHVLGAAAVMPERVAHAVLLGAPVHGVSPLGRSSAIAHRYGLRHALDWTLGPSARNMVTGSGVLPDLRDLPDGPRYLLLASRHDRLVRPAYLARAGIDDALRVTWVQDVEPRRRVSHTDLVSDALVYRLLCAELDTPARAASGLRRR